jgi:hypothetical protein
MEIQENLKRYEGKYLKSTSKLPKTKPSKGNDLQRINLVSFSHNGKLSRHGGAL